MSCSVVVWLYYRQLMTFIPVPELGVLDINHHPLQTWAAVPPVNALMALLNWKHFPVLHGLGLRQQFLIYIPVGSLPSELTVFFCNITGWFY